MSGKSNTGKSGKIKLKDNKSTSHANKMMKSVGSTLIGGSKMGGGGKERTSVTVAGVSKIGGSKKTIGKSTLGGNGNSTQYSTRSSISRKSASHLDGSTSGRGKNGTQATAVSHSPVSKVSHTSTGASKCTAGISIGGGKTGGRLLPDKKSIPSTRKVVASGKSGSSPSKKSVQAKSASTPKTSNSISGSKSLGHPKTVNLLKQSLKAVNSNPKSQKSSKKTENESLNIKAGKSECNKSKNKTSNHKSSVQPSHQSVKKETVPTRNVSSSSNELKSSNSNSSSVEQSRKKDYESKTTRERSSFFYRCPQEYDQSTAVAGTFEPFIRGGHSPIVVATNEDRSDNLDKVITVDQVQITALETTAHQQPLQTSMSFVICNPSDALMGKTGRTHSSVKQKVQSVEPTAASLKKSKKMSEAKKMATGGVNRFDFDMSKAIQTTNKTEPPAEAAQTRNRDRNQNRGGQGGSADQSAALELLVAGAGILERAQQAKRTRFGMPVQMARLPRLTTVAEQEQIRAKPTIPKQFLLILNAPFNQVSVITKLLGLTGSGGIVQERFEQSFQRPVRCVINVTYEAPLLAVAGLETFRVPVEDDRKENISIYFEEVTSKMNTFQARDEATIVHCMAGVSRSATFVLAYLIRYHQMSLEQAFRHTKSARSVINPNLGFLEQLAGFEATFRPVEECSRWREHTANGITKRLPEFIINSFLEDYEIEFD